MKKNLLFSLCALVLLASGCGAGNEKIPSDTKSSDVCITESEESSMRSYETERSEILSFMMEKYALTEEDLAGYDLVRLNADYDFQNVDYTAEEVREILADQGQYYMDTGYTKLFSILDMKEEGKITRDSEIVRIGFYYNEGTLLRKIIYDLREKSIYNNSVEPAEMSDIRYKKLSALAGDYDIYSWDNYYEGEEKPSTGSLRWKIVFLCADGSACAYGGYTQDMTHLPENFTEVREVLLDAAS